MRIPVQVTEAGGLARVGEPIEVGVPLPRGAIPAGTSWIVLDEEGAALPGQFKPLISYPDGSVRAIHGVFLADMEPDQTRQLILAPGNPYQGKPLLREEKAAFHVDTGPMQATFNSEGGLTRLQLDGIDALDESGGPSMELLLTLGPAGGSMNDGRVSMLISEEASKLQARTVESGPVRAILNISGSIFLKDRRGTVEFRLDADCVFYAGRSEIHVRPMLIGAVTEACMLNEWGLVFRLRNGRRMAYGREIPLIREDPDHENMTWRGIEQGWVSWDLAGGLAFAAWSPDIERHQNGFVNTQVIDRDRERIEVKFHRIEPRWDYQDVSSVPKPISVPRGGWRRWEAVFSLGDRSLQPAEMARGWAAPLRAYPSPEHYLSALSPRLEGKSTWTMLRGLVASKCEEFICKEPEYVGSINGGWDGPNGMYIERGVSRGDFGEYLFHEFFRSAEDRFYRMAFDFGRIYRDIFCFTIDAASDGPHELGGSRSRASEHGACIVRSMRGAVLLACMYQETGDARYLDALCKRADFLVANYPHYVGRQSMSVTDLAFLADYLDRPALIDKAVEVTLNSLDKHFDPEHGFFEAYDLTRDLDDGRYPAYPMPDGTWFMRDFLYTSNASPEMTAYNIIGWYGLWRLHGLDPEIQAKIRRVAEWFRDKQNDDGSWPYPHDSSATRWGHGSLQDALAMLYAYKMFGDESFHAAARRSIEFTQDCLDNCGRVPLLLGLLPHEETEDSLLYYYGIETLALYDEVVE